MMMMIMMIMIIIMIIIIIFRGVARTFFFAVGDVEVNACVVTGNLVYTVNFFHNIIGWGGGEDCHTERP